MAEPVLKIDRRDGVAILTLNRPGAMNALSRELRTAIADAFATLGIGHLLAVSGLHLTLVGGLAFAAARFVLRRVPSVAALCDARRLALIAALAATAG